jgi:hypothetical protein
MSLNDRAYDTARQFYEYYATFQRSPTVREMAELLQMRSTHTAYQYMVRAAELGLIEHNPGRCPAFLPVPDTRLARIAQLCYANEDGLAAAILCVLHESPMTRRLTPQPTRS